MHVMKLGRCLLLVALVIAPSGCMHWTPVRAPAPAPDAPRRLGAARVTRADLSVLELHYVVVTADSVVGWRAARPAVREALAHAQVGRIEHQGPDLGRTGLALLLAGVVVLYVQLASGI